MPIRPRGRWWRKKHVETGYLKVAHEVKTSVDLCISFFINVYYETFPDSLWVIAIDRVILKYAREVSLEMCTSLAPWGCSTRLYMCQPARPSHCCSFLSSTPSFLMSPLGFLDLLFIIKQHSEVGNLNADHSGGLPQTQMSPYNEFRQNSASLYSHIKADFS